jgi:hypothetical protein
MLAAATSPVVTSSPVMAARDEPEAEPIVAATSAG